MKRGRFKITLLGIVGTLVVIILLAGFSPFVSVPSGHTGVVVTFGRVEDYVFGEGFHLKTPVQKVVMMDNRTQKANVSLSAFSSDIQQVDVICTVNYATQRDSVQALYQNVGENYYQVVMVPRIQENVKAVFAQYTAEKLMEVRNSLSGQIKEMLSPEMNVYGIEIVSVSVEDVDFSDAFTDAVEAKQVAEQTKLKTQTEQAALLIVEQSTAERKIIAANADAQEKQILATANAEIEKVQADAEAYAVRVKAEAEAEANQKIAESLTDPLIQYVETNRWDGALPHIVGADHVLPIVDINE